MRHTTLCFLLRGEEILFALKKRGFGVGKMTGVGGKVEADETIEEAMIREANEEIKITANITDLEKIAELDFTFENKESWNQLCHVFFLKKWGGEPVETEEMRPEWIHESKLPYEKMWLDDEYWLPQALSGKKIKAKFHFNVECLRF